MFQVHTWKTGRYLAFFTAICILLSISAVAAPVGGPPAESIAASVYFSDVTGDGVDAVDTLYEAGLISGITSPARNRLGTFCPDISIRRGDFALLLSRAFTGDLNYKPVEAFSDVAKTAYYSKAVARAASLGLMYGNGEGLFRPEDPISQEEAYTILYRAAQAGCIDGCALADPEAWALALVQDANSISSWAREAMESLLVSGVLSPEKLAPAEDCTRLDMARALSALLATDLSGQQAPEEYDEAFVVIHTNDVHGYIQNEAKVRPVADYYKSLYGDANVITVSAGDIYAGGAAVAHYYKGELIPGIMDAAGYDYVVPGNNDYNLENSYPGQYEALAAMAGYTTLAADLYRADADGNSTGELVFDPYDIITTGGGVQIGLFGLAMGGGESSYMRDDLITSANMVAELTDAGCTAIIGIGHKGWNDEPTDEEEINTLIQVVRGMVEADDYVDPDAEEEDNDPPPMGNYVSGVLADLTEGMDAFVDGHSHSIIGGGNGWVSEKTGCIVVQAGEKGNNIGVLKLYFKDGEVVKKTATLLDEADMAAFQSDPATQALVDAAYARFAEDTAKPVGETPYNLNAARQSGNNGERGIRSDEQNLGDLAADALRWKLKTNVAFVPGVGLRASINAGAISLGDWFGVFANGGDFGIAEMTGEELIEALASGLAALPNESPGFNQVSGVTFSYLLDDETITILNPTVNGEPVDLEAVYTVARSANGRDAPADMEILLTGMETLAELMTDYMQTEDCVIYPDVVRPDGRIVPLEELPADATAYCFVKNEMMG